MPFYPSNAPVIYSMQPPIQSNPNPNAASNNNNNSSSIDKEIYQKQIDKQNELI